MIFYPLFDSETSSYTYLIADATTRDAILIDPVLEKVERDAKLVSELGLRLRYVLDTHVHADHITGAAALRALTGARTAISRVAGVTRADLALDDGATLRVGTLELVALATPGHTDGCMSFVAGDRVFTGDALMIRGNGRTDFQQGSSAALYRSIVDRLYRLPDPTLVHPAHDYKGLPFSTIGLEKQYNARIPYGQTEEGFVRIMRELKLAEPKKIAEAVPANLRGGHPPEETHV